MRARTAAAFTIGFAAGVLFLAVTLWATGHLVTHTPSGPPPNAYASSALPDFSSSPPQLPSPMIPELITPQAQGSADRAAPNAPNSPPSLAMPLAGVDPSTIPNSFDDARTGHKHEALDIMAPRGTPVKAVAEGNVVKLFNSKQGGITVYQFDNSRTYCYYYAHLDRYAPGLKEGMLLRTGDVLGYVGSTGDASPNAPHLHFAVFELGPDKKWYKGTAINPLPLLQHTPAAAGARTH